MFERLLRNDELVRMIVKGKIKGRRIRGSPRMAYSKQLFKKWIGVGSLRGQAAGYELRDKRLALKLDDSDECYE